MSPSAQTSSAEAAPLPPLPDMQSSGGGQSQSSSMQSLVAGIAPIKTGVDSIAAACKSIVQSGMVPGSEQICGQIVALAASLLPMAAQQALQPGAGSGGSVPPVGAVGGA